LSLCRLRYMYVAFCTFIFIAFFFFLFRFSCLFSFFLCFIVCLILLTLFPLSLALRFRVVNHVTASGQELKWNFLSRVTN
jgi:hypothetical protein